MGAYSLSQQDKEANKVATYRIFDQTDYNNSSTIDGGHFGVNLVTIYDEEFAGPESDLAARAVEMGVTTLRYPGGSATEHFFDMANPNEAVSNFDPTHTLLPMDQFLAQAGAMEISASIVIPTKRGFTASASEAMLDGTYGQRNEVDDAYLERVLIFVTETVAAAEQSGVPLTAFELGNEFWGSGQMTAREYGTLMAVLVPAIEQRLDALGSGDVQIVVQSVSSASQLYSPRDSVTAFIDPDGGYDAIYLQEYIDSNFGGVQPDGWVQVTVPAQGSAYQQLNDLVGAINQGPGAATAIDGILDHYYVGGGFDAVDTGFEFGFNQFHRFANLLDRLEGMRDPEFHITEWNASSRDAQNNRGLQHAGMLVESFYEMVTHGIDTAQIWPLSFDVTQSVSMVTVDQQQLTIAGETFTLMRDSLVDLQPTFDWSASSDIDVHGFGDNHRLVLFASERSGQDRQNITLDLGEFLDEHRYFVTATHLGDGGAGGRDHRATAELSYQNGNTRNTNSASFDLEEYALVRYEFTRVGMGANEVQGRGGNDRILGFGGDDTLSGGDGRDLISGGGGDDILLGQNNNDRLFGNGGNDFLHGGRGRDHVFGGNGNDTLLTSSGRDLLSGGNGNDTFVFAEGEHRDLILDFDLAADRIDISAWGITDLNDLTYTTMQAPHEGAVIRSFISFEDNRIRLNGLGEQEMADLTTDHFIF